MAERPPQKACSQCGRIGVRGFNVLQVVYEGVNYGAITECANRVACRRRFERQRPPGAPDG